MIVAMLLNGQMYGLPIYIFASTRDPDARPRASDFSYARSKRDCAGKA